MKQSCAKWVQVAVTISQAWMLSEHGVDWANWEAVRMNGCIWEIGSEQVGWRQWNEYERHLGVWAPSFLPCTGRAACTRSAFCQSWKEHPAMKAEVTAGGGLREGSVFEGMSLSSEASVLWGSLPEPPFAGRLFTLQDFCLGIFKASGSQLWLVDLHLVTDSLPSLAVPQKLCWGTVPAEQAWTS